MSFKVDESFLRFVTMGAMGTRAVTRMLDQAGHCIIELERYSSSNKIWSTKIKRLRLADLLCLHCGTRFEVRTKSDLEVKMSDSPDNVERRWDAGLQERDICAFIACHERDGLLHVAETACYFTVGVMRQALLRSRLGPPKSASEGSERDRTWPTWAPSRDGWVAEVTEIVIRVRYDDGAAYTYRLNDKRSYCQAGDRFCAGDRILAGVLGEHHIPCCQQVGWDVMADLTSDDITRQYAAVKALGHLRLGQERIDEQLLGLAQGCRDPRVALEAAATLAKRGDARGQAMLRSTFDDAPIGHPYRMEVVLILSEIDEDWAATDLEQIAIRPDIEEEVASACVWGLGAQARPRPETVLRFLSHPADGVVIHAIVALTRCLSMDQVPSLIASLDQHERLAAAAAEVLYRSPRVSIDALVKSAFQETRSAQVSEWAKYILGRLPEDLVLGRSSELGISSSALSVLAPLWRGLQKNWLATRSGDRLAFVARQIL